MGQEREGSRAIAISRVAEAEIGGEFRQQVQALLQTSFADYPQP